MPNVRGKQKLRHNTGKYANRGGKYKEWYNALYGGFRNYSIDPHMEGHSAPIAATSSVPKASGTFS